MESWSRPTEAHAPVRRGVRSPVATFTSQTAAEAVGQLWLDAGAPAGSDPSEPHAAAAAAINASFDPQRKGAHDGVMVFAYLLKVGRIRRTSDRVMWSRWLSSVAVPETLTGASSRPLTEVFAVEAHDGDTVAPPWRRVS